MKINPHDFIYFAWLGASRGASVDIHEPLRSVTQDYRYCRTANPMARALKQLVYEGLKGDDCKRVERVDLR